MSMLPFPWASVPVLIVGDHSSSQLCAAGRLACGGSRVWGGSNALALVCLIYNVYTDESAAFKFLLTSKINKLSRLK